MISDYFAGKARREALARLTPKQRAEVVRAEAEQTLARLARAKKPDKEDDDKPPAKHEIDILAHEMETGAPHWLSQQGKGKGKAPDNLSEKRKQEIRDKHRAKAKKKPPAK